MTKLCKNCRFFQKYWADTQDTSTGECHRWPEAVAKLPAHWCGEWKRRRSPNASGSR